MQIKDMTQEQLQDLIRQTVAEMLDEYFDVPDEGEELKESFKQSLLEIQQKRQAGRPTISAEEVDQRYGIEQFAGIFADDPLFDDFVKDMAAYRQEIDDQVANADDKTKKKEINKAIL